MFAVAVSILVPVALLALAGRALRDPQVDPERADWAPGTVARDIVRAGAVLGAGDSVRAPEIDTHRVAHSVI